MKWMDHTIARSFATCEKESINWPLVLFKVSIDQVVYPGSPSGHLDPQDYAHWSLVHCMLFSWHICNNRISDRLRQSSLPQSCIMFAHEIIEYWWCGDGTAWSDWIGIGKLISVKRTEQSSLLSSVRAHPYVLSGLIYFKSVARCSMDCLACLHIDTYVG